MMRFFRNNQGAIAPMAIFFVMLSLVFTIAYLSRATTQARLELYRYAKKKALLVAEAGLNKVAIDELPYVKSETTFVEIPVAFGKDENNNILGKYGDVGCEFEIDALSQRTIYKAKSVGIVEIENKNHDIIEVKDSLYAQFVPVGFGDYMYFTDQEEPSGPPNEDANGFINFGANDTLEGKIHTNGTIALSQFGCPTIREGSRVTLGEGGGISFSSACDESIFEDQDGNSIVDTIPPIVYPPNNTVALVKAEANRIFEADNKIYMDGPIPDTLIMTHIRFVETGYWVNQWSYIIPPATIPISLNYLWDDTSPDMEVFEAGVHLYQAGDPPGEIHYNPEPADDPVGYGDPTWLVISDIDADAINHALDWDTLHVGSLIKIKSTNSNKSMSFTTGGSFSLSGDRQVIGISGFSYVSNVNEGFTNLDEVEVTIISSSGGLDPDVEFNDFAYFHDHPDTPNHFCRADGFHHFDFPGYFEPDNPKYEVMAPVFFTKRDWDVIYVKGGQVLVEGVVDGRYTIVTDDYVEYRRSDNPNKIDRVWGNIWIVDDLVYLDSGPNGRVVQPSEGGTSNVMGLVAGGNVIIANTEANGARNSMWRGPDDPGVIINAAIIAMNEAFLAHYWQNSINIGVCTGHDCGEPIPTDPYNSRGDGRGRYRNNGVNPTPSGTTQDFRGKIIVYGSIVQRQRGYVKRNAQGPYMISAPGIGYNKDYNYDYNLREAPPPHFPTLETVNGQTILTLQAYGSAIGNN